MQRLRGGMTQIENPVNNESLLNPSLDFVEKPKYNARSLLITNRKEEMLTELKKIEGNFETHNDPQKRIDDREVAILRGGYKEKLNRTCHDIEEERKQNMIADMTKKFGNVVNLTFSVN